MSFSPFIRNLLSSLFSGYFASVLNLPEHPAEIPCIPGIFDLHSRFPGPAAQQGNFYLSDHRRKSVSWQSNGSRNLGLLLPLSFAVMAIDHLVHDAS
jgi:hypothetical protein